MDATTSSTRRPSTQRARARRAQHTRARGHMAARRGACRRLLLLCLPVCARAPVVHARAGKNAGLKTSGNSQGTVLVTGVAGFIGSHMAFELLERGRRVVGVDNMVRGSQEAIDELSGFPRFTFVQADLADGLHKVFNAHRVTSVYHFAAMASVAESFKKPMTYHRNITVNTQRLVDQMLAYKIPTLVYSSTCAVYGSPPPHQLPITESTPTDPTSPYGLAKLSAEKYIQGKTSSSFTAQILRYFNVVGARADGRLCEHPSPQLGSLGRISTAVFDTARKVRPCVPVYDRALATPDGSAIRDYIHVQDLVLAHLAVEHQPTSQVWNVATGRPTSTLEFIRAAERVSGLPVPICDEVRDTDNGPVSLHASSASLQQATGWTPTYRTITDALRTSWNARLPGARCQGQTSKPSAAGLQAPGDSAAREDGSSAVRVASARRQQLRIAIGVLALARDAPQVDTLLRRLTVSQNVPASSILIVVNNITATLEAIGRQYSVAHFESGCVEARSLVCKSVSLFRRLVTFMPAAHWYTLMSLDCFVVYPNFVAALSRLDSSQRIYTGCANRLTTSSVHMKHFIPKHMRSIPHAGSGPLFALSHPLAHWFSENWRLYYDPLRGEAPSITNDVGFGAFLTLVANVPVTDMPGILQDPAITELPGRWVNTTVDDCPCPLPPPVHHQSKEWMRAAPVVPLEWPSFVALHAKQNTWHVWEALERQRQTIAAANEEMLVYFNTAVEGSLAYQAWELSFCKLKPSQRLDTWRSWGVRCAHVGGPDRVGGHRVPGR